MTSVAYTQARPANWTTKSRINRPEGIFGLFVLSLFISLLGIVTIQHGQLVYLGAKTLLLGLVLGSLLLPRSRGFLLFLITLVCAPELIQSSSERILFGELASASPWASGLIISPGVFLLLITSLHCLRFLIAGGSLPRDQFLRLSLLFFITVPFVIGALYHGFSMSEMRVMLSDFRYVLLGGISLCLVYAFLAEELSRIADLVKVLVIAITAVSLVHIMLIVSGFGPTFAGVSRGSVDSTKALAVVPLMVGVSSFLFQGQRRFVGAVIATISMIVILSYMTRLIWVTATMSLILLLFLSRRPGAAVLSLISIPMILGLSLISLSFLAPDTYTHFMHRLNSLLIYLPGSGHVDMRVAQMINLIHHSWDNFYVIWGNGYGGYYTDEYVRFSADLTDAFSYGESISGRYYGVHNFFGFFYLKMGIVGLVLLVGVWVKPYWSSVKNIMPKTNRLISGPLFIAILATFPVFMLHFYSSAKGAFFSGFYIAICLLLAKVKIPAVEVRDVGNRSI